MSARVGACGISGFIGGILPMIDELYVTPRVQGLKHDTGSQEDSSSWHRKPHWDFFRIVGTV